MLFNPDEIPRLNSLPCLPYHTLKLSDTPNQFFLTLLRRQATHRPSHLLPSLLASSSSHFSGPLPLATSTYPPPPLPSPPHPLNLPPSTAINTGGNRPSCHKPAYYTNVSLTILDRRRSRAPICDWTLLTPSAPSRTLLYLIHPIRFIYPTGGSPATSA